MLQTRKSRVIFVTPTTSYEINLTRDQLLAGMEIEEHIVADVVCSGFNVHCFFISFDISVHSKRSHVTSSTLSSIISMSSLICYCFLLVHRYKVTKISWPQYLYNDLFVAENSCESTAK